MRVHTLCYLKRNGKTLMLHRVKKSDDVHHGKWNGLGGKFELGETPEECVKREVFEESGLTVKEPHLRGYMTFPKFAHNEDWTVFIFTATEFEGELAKCQEGELKWIPDAEIPKLNLWEGDRIFLEWLKQEEFFSAKFVYKNRKLVEHEVKFYKHVNPEQIQGLKK